LAWIRSPRFRRRMLLVGELLILVAAVISLFSVIGYGPVRVMAFILVAQPALVLGVLLYLAVALSEFLGSRGVSRLRFEAGETIFRQGDAADRMYALIDGQVEIIREAPEGEHVLACLGPGEYFGEMSLVSSGPRLATVRTLTVVEVAVMGREDFATLYAYLPDFHRNLEQMVRRRQVAWGAPGAPQERR
jgi:hypothetical protein